MGLSVCMIVKNEAAALPGCLQSVAGVADEVVVVDTGSTDDTVAIAQSWGAIVHTHPWQDDFAAARNVSLAAAQQDWILVLDADEVLTPGIVPLIRQVMAAPEVLVATLLREELGAQQTPYSLVSRLFRNHPAIHFRYPYHELIDDSVLALQAAEPGWRVVELPGVALRHTGYQPEAIAARQKVDRAQRIMEQFLATQPDDPYICNKLGALYVSNGEIGRGLTLLQAGLRQPATPAVRYELHTHLGDTYGQLQSPTQAESHYQLALAEPVPDRLKLSTYLNWGNLRLERGDCHGAKDLYERALTVEPAFAAGHFNLGKALKQLGDLPGAIAHYQEALTIQPTYADAYQNLGVALLKAGQVFDALAALQRAIALHEQHGSPEGERLRRTLKDMGFSVK